MKFESLRLHSSAYQEPAQFMTSDEMEDKMSALYERAKLPKGRLELQTGINRRGFWPNGTRPSTT